MKSFFSQFVKIIGFMFIALLAFTVISSKASGGEPTLFHYQLKIVLSGSMEPNIRTGSIIINELTQEDTDFKKGDIITFQAGERTITHRIIDVLDVNGEKLFETKGDNNKVPDPDYVHRDQILSKYTGIMIPKIGYLLSYTTTRLGSALLLIIPGITLVLYALQSILFTLREFESQKA